MDPTPPAVLLLSGGVDSAVLLARECAAGRTPLCLSVDYGQRHSRELTAAAELAHRFAARWEVCYVGSPARSALTGAGGVPLDLPADDPAQAATVVPGRNALLLSLAAGVAASRGVPVVLFAAHSGDAAVYPDCRETFVRRISEALEAGCGVRVEAPFLSMDKAAVVRLGRELRVPFHLTYSCYVGEAAPCGRCGACVARKGAGL